MGLETVLRTCNLWEWKCRWMKPWKSERRKTRRANFSRSEIQKPLGFVCTDRKIGSARFHGIHNFCSCWKVVSGNEEKKTILVLRVWSCCLSTEHAELNEFLWITITVQIVRALRVNCTFMNFYLYIFYKIEPRRRNIYFFFMQAKHILQHEMKDFFIQIFQS